MDPDGGRRKSGRIKEMTLKKKVSIKISVIGRNLISNLLIYFASFLAQLEDGLEWFLFLFGLA
jgi:hypothetical protein